MPKLKGEIGIEVLITAVLGIVLLVVANSVGADVTTKINENQLAFNTLSVVNESLTNASTMTIAGYNVLESSVVVWNGTLGSNVTFPAANYTLSCTGARPNIVCSINISSSSYTGFSETAVFGVSYTHDGYYQTNAFNISSAGTTALDDIPDWYGTIVVVIVASFILVLLISRFSKVGTS